MKTNRLLSLLIALFCLASAWQGRAANIVWVSDQPNTNINLVGTVAFWSPPIMGVTDDSFVTLLQNAGHNVVRFTSDDSQNNALSQADIDGLNTNDVIIIGRATGSGAFQTGLQSGQWNTNITKPIILQSSFLTRASRLGWFAAEDAHNGAPTPLVTTNSFNTNSAYLLNLFSSDVVGSITVSNYDEALEQNTSQTVDAPVAGATVLARANTTNNAIVEFKAGTLVKTNQALAGYRLFFAAGNRETSLLATAGNETLTPSGEKIFLRAVNLALANGVAPNTGSAPVITSSPTDTNFCTGLPLTLTATATGQNPLYFQWFTNDVAIPSGTNATLSFIFQAANAGTYTVVVSNAIAGLTAVTSAPAIVGISGSGTVAPPIATQNICPGSPVTFTTAATGSGTLSYTWRKGAAIVQGPDGNNSFNIPAVTTAHGGAYSVTVVGDCNTVSNNFTLNVIAAPSITTQPINQTTPMGNGAVFTVAATAAVTPTYQWQINGEDVIGATGTTFAISNLTLLDSGKMVSVIASTCAGSTPSTAAILTVTPISGISFDFDTPGQFTNAPYSLTWNTWINNGFANPPAVFESPIGGVGPLPGSGSLDMPANSATENTSLILPVNFDFSLPGKTLFASTMFKLKAPITAGRRATQFGFVTQTNIGINDTSPQSFMTVILQDPTANVSTLELRTQCRSSGGRLQESVFTQAPGLIVSNWYKLTISFTNTLNLGVSNFGISAVLQDMGPLGTTPGATVLSMSSTTNTADLVQFKNVYLALRSFEDGGMDFRDNTYVWTTPGPIAFVQQPQSQTVLQGRRTQFKALVDGEGPYTYQWSKNGTPIPGARSWNYVVPSATTADNAATYTVEVTGPANTITSSAATLTVTPETLAVVSAGSVDGTTVGVMFSQPVNPTTAQNPANYTINGAAPAQARIFRSSLGALGPEGIYVVLTPATIVAGPFTVVASGVQDLSGGTVGGANTASGTVAGLTGYDVNPLITGPAGENYSFGPGQFIVAGNGSDIFSGGDAFRYVYTTKTGDFDVVFKIPYMDSTRFTAKAGIDVRAYLDPFSPGAFVGFDPGPIGEGTAAPRQFTEGTAKLTWGAGGTSWGNATRLFHPNVWLRFRRVGNSFLRYSSSNGTTWLFDGQISPNPALPSTVYFGLAVCAARNLQAESVQFENVGDFAGYAGATITINSQPTNITVNAGSGATIGGLVASVSGGGIPTVAGELAYTWQRNDGAGGWTNMPTAGATNNLLSVGTVWGTDNSAQYRVIVSAPGALPVTSAVATLTVNDTTAPTLAAVNLPQQSSYPSSSLVLTFSEPVSAATALNIANYTVTNAAGVVFNVTSASFLGIDPRTVVLQVDGILVTDFYGVRISNVQDLKGVSIATVTRTFRNFTAPTAPVVIQIYQDIGAGVPLSNLTLTNLFTNNEPTLIVYSNLFGFNVVNGFGSSQDQYGVKAMTYFIPPTNGNYKFWIRGDDTLQLWMNTNAVNSTDPAGKVLIADLTANNGTYNVGTTPANSRTNIALVAGQAYYLEALMKENNGGDGFSVTWTDPGVNTAPTIPPAFGTVPVAGSLIPTANLAYPASAAPATPVITEMYTGYTGRQNYNGNIDMLISATNFPGSLYIADSVAYKYIAGTPDVIGFQKSFATQPSLYNTRFDNYLGRMMSLFVAPSNGLYKFYMRADDSAQLWMNTNAVNSADPAGKSFLGQLEASTFYYTVVAENVSLAAGQKYYIEALWREGGGGDGVAVTVRSQNDPGTPYLGTVNTAPSSGTATEVIPASMLEYPTAVSRAGEIKLAAVLPASPVVADGQTVTLTANGIFGAPPYGTMWYKNGQLVFVNSITNIIGPVTMADNNAVYTLVVTNIYSRAERSTTLTVVPDSTAPTVVRTVGRRYNDGFTIVFSEPVDAVTATFLGNYQVSGGIALLRAALDPTRKMVSFETTPQALATTYMITINGVKDASSAGNLIAANTTTGFSTWTIGGRGFLVELFTNIQGTAILDLTGTLKFQQNLPDVIYYTNVFGVGVAGQNTGLENYGARITGYFVPTNTSYYRFFLRSDDASQLLMNFNSADSENPAGRTLLLHMPNAGVSMQDARSISPPVSLNAGQRYYVEVLLKEGTGGDYVNVNVRQTDANGAFTALANQDTEIISYTMNGGAPGDPGAVSIVSGPPADVSVNEGEAVTLAVVASVPPYMQLAPSYTWQKWDGAAFTNIPAASQSSFTFFANGFDDGIQYRVLASFPGTNATFVTTLHILGADTTAPYIVEATALSATNVGVRFSEPIAGVDNFYFDVFVGGTDITILDVKLRADGTSVIITTDPLGPAGTPFTVVPDSVTDIAGNPAIGSTNGIVQGFAPLDVGAPAALGSSYSSKEGEIDVIAGGADVWGASDQGHFTLRPTSGDFDIHARVQSLAPRSAFPDIAKAGLMVRATLNANSANLNFQVNPPLSVGGRDLGEAGQRQNDGGGTAAWPITALYTPLSASYVPVGIPNAWLRIKRVGDLFTAYRSSDGVNWTEYARSFGGFGETVYAGLTTCAHNNATPATVAEYRDVYIPMPPTITAQPSPADQTVALGGPVTYTAAAANRPNSGPLTYQWWLNGVKIPGATAATLTISSADGADAGSYTVTAGNDGGWARSAPATLAVSNALPVAASDSLTTIQNIAVSLVATNVMTNDVDPEGALPVLLGVNGQCANMVNTDFSRGLPAGSAIYGNALLEGAAGVGGSADLMLTPGVASHAGSIVFSELNPGVPAVGFQASFMLRIADGSGQPADGFSFNFASDLLDGASFGAEAGIGTGFSFIIDSYQFTGSPFTSGLEIKYKGASVARVQTPTWLSPAYVPVSITVAPNGSVAVLVDGTNVFPGLVLANYVPAAGRFGIYARTGGQFQSHRLDNLSLSVMNRTPRGGLVAMDNTTGIVTYTPPTDACGSDSFIYYLSDGQEGGTVCGLVNVQIAETTPTAPTITTCAPDRTFTLYVTNKAVLPDLTAEVVATDNCTFSLSQNPAAGTLLNAGTTNIVTITATDGMGLSATCQTTVIVGLVSPEIIAGSATYAGGTFSSSFATGVGVSYVVEYKDDLAATAWTTLIVIPGDGTVKTFTDPGPLPSMRFYRVTAQ